MNKPPWFYPMPEPQSLAQQFRDFSDTLKAMEDWNKSNKPKEENKDGKKNFLKTYIMLGLAFPFIVLAFMWLEFTIFIDILEKAQHITLNK